MAGAQRLDASLAGLPVEILLEVFQHLDLQATFELSLTNTEFYLFFQRRKLDILLPVLRREYSPFDELLQVYTASIHDIGNDGHYKPRNVVFKRFVRDQGLNRVDVECAPISLNLHQRAQVRTPAAASSYSATIVLKESDLKGLLRHCRLVREWEALFPQMRWYHQPEDCRMLRPPEQLRFRRALYRWWMYGIHFHGDSPRPRVGHPEPYVDDARTSQMRYHSTAELLELMDFLETVKDVILHYICPRLDPTPYQLFPSLSSSASLIEILERGQSLRTGWNDQSHWSRIVKTYAKLGPEELLYYFNNIYRYSRKRLIAEVHGRHSGFTFDQESMQIAIRCALDEREWEPGKINLPEHGVGGIVDFDDERDDERPSMQGDGSPDGRLPRGARLVQSYSRYSPRGDDGSFLDDYLRMSASEHRAPMSTALQALNRVQLTLPCVVGQGNASRDEEEIHE